MFRSCRSRQDISNEYYFLFTRKIGADPAENEPSKVSRFIPTDAIPFHVDIPLGARAGLTLAPFGSYFAYNVTWLAIITSRKYILWKIIHYFKLRPGSLFTGQLLKTGWDGFRARARRAGGG